MWRELIEEKGTIILVVVILFILLGLVIPGSLGEKIKVSAEITVFVIVLLVLAGLHKKSHKS